MAKEITNKELLNSLKKDASEEYKRNVPDATDYNLQEVSRAILEYPTIKNEFINTLTNKVSKTIFLSKLYNNPFKFFKKGSLPFGKTIEMVFVDLIERKSFEDNFGASEASSLIGTLKPTNVIPEYHSENFRNKYKLSISDTQLKGALLNSNGLSELINAMTVSALNTAEFDEFKMVKQLISNVEVTNITLDGYSSLTENEQGKKLTKTIKTYINKFRFLSNKWNTQGVHTFTTPNEIVVLVTPETKANIDVELLSSAFNLSKAEIESRLVLIDEFINADGTEDTETLAMVIDENLVQFYETENTTESFRNADTLTTNMFYHRWGIMSATGFVNAIKIKSATV